MKPFTIKKICSVLEYSTTETGWISNERSHHILAYQTSGFYFHHFENQTLLFKPDTFFFIHQKDRYRVETTVCGGSSLCIHFLSDEPLDLPSFAVNCLDNPTVKQEFKKILNAWSESPEENHFLCHAILYRLLHTAKTLKEKPFVPSKTKKLAETLALEIERRYATKIDLPAFCDELGYSFRYVNKLFKEKYGVTPTQYLVNLRILKSMELLAETKLKIGEIAAQTGFSDEYYFSKFFKKQTGTSPSAFRKQSV